MKTIKTKLFLTFLLSMVAFIALCILLNIVFLEKYYIFANKDSFIKAEFKIKDEYINNLKNIDQTLNSVDRVDGIKCTIANNDMKNLYDSSPSRLDGKTIFLPSEIEQLIKADRENSSAKYIYTIVESPDFGNKNITYISKLDEKTFIILQKSIDSIVESSKIANTFFVFTGLFIILLGSVFIYIFSKKLTMPIVEMSIISEDMSNLDFSKRVDVKTNDEIGSLGKSINKLSQKLSTSINKLLDDAERKKQLIRNVSHELKTPIGVIKGYAEGLKFGVADDKQKLDKYCTVIASECDRMDGMVKEILELSSLEEAVNLQLSSFDVSDLINNISDKFAPAIKEKEINIDVNCRQGTSIIADYELLERAISNYLNNAINHIDDKKYVKITTSVVENGVKITVFNTGNRISDIDMKNIWDVFYKVDKARSREYGGFGLGLSIVKSIVDAHNGTYGALNVDGGVEFYLIIPIKK